MMWSECNWSSALSSQHDKVGFFDVKLDSTGGSAQNVEGLTKNEVVLRHGLIMWTSWFIFGFFQIGSQRWWKKELNSPMLHSVFGILVTVATLFAAFDLYTRYGFKANDPHTILGGVITFSSALILITGVANSVSMNFMNFGTKKLRIIKKFHRVISIGVFLLGIASCSSGISKFTGKNAEGYRFLVGVNFLLQSIIFIAAEVNFRKRRRGEVELIPENDSVKISTISEE